jgi:hypothetical protein
MQRLFLKPADEFWKAQLRASGAIRSGISGRPSVQSIPVEIDAVKASVGPIWPLALHAHFTDAQRQLLTACDQLRSSIVGSTKVLHVLDDVLMSTAGVGRLPPIPLHAALAAKHIPLASLLPVGYHVTLPASFEAHEFASHISGITTAWRRRCQVLEEPKYDVTTVGVLEPADASQGAAGPVTPKSMTSYAGTATGGKKKPPRAGGKWVSVPDLCRVQLPTLTLLKLLQFVRSSRFEIVSFGTTSLHPIVLGFVAEFD